MNLKYCLYLDFQDLSDDEDVIETIRSSRKLSRKDAIAIRKRLETEKDMQNCFGFDVSKLLLNICSLILPLLKK